MTNGKAIAILTAVMLLGCANVDAKSMDCVNDKTNDEVVFVINEHSLNGLGREWKQGVIAFGAMAFDDVTYGTQYIAMYYAKDFDTWHIDTISHSNNQLVDKFVCKYKK
jgi:hypothetical protein